MEGGREVKEGEVVVVMGGSSGQSEDLKEYPIHNDLEMDERAWAQRGRCVRKGLMPLI